MNPIANSQNSISQFSHFSWTTQHEVIHDHEETNLEQKTNEPHDSTAELVGDILALVPMKKQKISHLFQVEDLSKNRDLECNNF